MSDPTEGPSAETVAATEEMLRLTYEALGDDGTPATSTETLTRLYSGNKRSNWTAYVVTDLLAVARERDRLAARLAAAEPPPTCPNPQCHNGMISVTGRGSDGPEPCPDCAAEPPPTPPERQSYTVYLAGPMRGYEDFNFPAFDAASTYLRGFGWAVLSPAERDRDEGFDEKLNTLDGFDLAAAMRHDLAWVIDADGIVLLPGWEDSTGARIERLVAETCGKDVWLYTPGHGAKMTHDPVMVAALATPPPTPEPLSETERIWLERLAEWDSDRLWLDGSWWEVDHFGTEVDGVCTDVVMHRMDPQPTPLVSPPPTLGAPEAEEPQYESAGACWGCHGDKYERVRGRDNDEIVIDCSVCGGHGSLYRRVPAPLTPEDPADG